MQNRIVLLANVRCGRKARLHYGARSEWSRNGEGILQAGIGFSRHDGGGAGASAGW